MTLGPGAARARRRPGAELRHLQFCPRASVYSRRSCLQLVRDAFFASPPAEWDSARVSYERALVLDSAFALASWRLGTVYWWSWPKTNDSLHRMYALRAGALNRGLSPRDSLLVLCDSITVTLDESELLDSAARENLPRLLSTAEALVRRYPTDPDAWYVLGEARFHFEAGLGVSDQRVLAAFEQVIALDSAYAPAYDPRLERGNPPAPRGSRWRPPAAAVPQ